MSSLSDRERRLALNEAMFREVNERISEVGEEFGLSPLDIVCECDRIDCTERIEISRELYEQLRAEATQYAVVSGHEAPEVESVVAREARFNIVRKHEGEPAEIARATDPRAG